MGQVGMESLLSSKLSVMLYVVRARLSSVLHLQALHPSSYLEARPHTPASIFHWMWMTLPIAICLRMALKQSFSSRLLQLFGMKFPCNIGIAWKQWIALCRMSLNATGLLVVLQCSGEGTSGRFSQWLRKAAERTILTTCNETVDELNHTILAKFSGVTHTFAGYDKVVHETQEQQGHYAEDLDAGYAPEYLQTLTPNGFPKAKLALKVGCPVMLLRNLDPSQGLCNGTRLLITRTSTHVLECRILGGDHDRNPVFIPRITLYSRKSDLTFILARRQFPVRLAFAMTINKSQGQSVKHVGIDLRTPVFTHGQLYVALSRATAKNQFYVLFPQGEAGTQTQNVVYPEVLL